MPIDGLDLADFAAGSLAQLQDYGMPHPSLHRVGSSVEFPVPATEEGIDQNAVASQFGLVPRRPQVVNVAVNCVNKVVLIPVLVSSRTHSRISVYAATTVHP